MCLVSIPYVSQAWNWGRRSKFALFRCNLLEEGESSYVGRNIAELLMGNYSRLGREPRLTYDLAGFALFRLIGPIRNFVEVKRLMEPALPQPATTCSAH